jgi:threonine synthase
LLDVVHDLAALKEIPAASWKQTFGQRSAQLATAYSSGVWGKKEWIAPHVREENIVSFREGNTPLVPATRLAHTLKLEHVWVKQCGTSHTGSFKDLGMTVLVSQVKQMVREGKRIKAVLCASTGDTSAALAAYCAAAQIPAVVLLPANKVSPAQLLQPIANGALTLALDTDFDGCMQLVQQLAQQPDVYLANSMNSLRLEGQKTVAIEIAQQLEWRAPDWVILPGGNLGNVSAMGKGFLMMRDLGLIERLPRLACAQAERANPLYESFQNGFRGFHAKPAQPTLASAIQIGRPVSYKKAINILRECNGVVEQASESELAEAAARADRDGLFCCPQTGVALAAMIKLAQRGVIRPDDRIVVISTASGLKFADFKIAYHQNALKDIAARYANRVKMLPPKFEKINEAINGFALSA